MIEEIWKVWKDTRIDTMNRRNNAGALWEVSNLGRVKKNGQLYNPGLVGNCGGYYVLPGTKYLHKIVAELFIPNPENKSQVDHIDTNKLNNSIENLRWVTPKENMNNPITKVLMKEKMVEFGNKRKGNPDYCGWHHSEEAKINMKKARQKYLESINVNL